MSNNNVISIFGHNNAGTQAMDYSEKKAGTTNWNVPTASKEAIGTTLEEQLQPVNYLVGARPNLTIDNNGNIVDTGKKTIFNVSNNKTLGIQAMGYNIVQNEQATTALLSEIYNSDLPTEHAFARTRVDNYGQTMMAEIVFPATAFEVTPGDEVAFSITAINSFNGSGSFHVKAGAYRFICANGMVSSTGVIEYRKAHKKDLSVKQAAKVIVCGMEQYHADKESLVKQANTPATEQDVYLALAIMNDIDLAVAPTYTEYQRVIRPTLKREPSIERHMGLWNKYKSELGATQWALNNVLTHIATHGDKPEYSASQKIGTRSTKEKLARTALRKMLAA